MTLVVKIAITLGVLVASQLIQRLLRRAIDKFIRTQNIKRSRAAALHKFKSFLIWLVTILLLVYLWGLGLKNVWVFISGILGIIAIGLFFVTLHDENDNELHIPNNVIFQKAVKRVVRR